MKLDSVRIGDDNADLTPLYFATNFNRSNPATLLQCFVDILTAGIQYLPNNKGIMLLFQKRVFDNITILFWIFRVF